MLFFRKANGSLEPDQKDVDLAHAAGQQREEQHRDLSHISEMIPEVRLSWLQDRLSTLLRYKIQGYPSEGVWFPSVTDGRIASTQAAIKHVENEIKNKKSQASAPEPAPPKCRPTSDAHGVAYLLVYQGPKNPGAVVLPAIGFWDSREQHWRLVDGDGSFRPTPVMPESLADTQWGIAGTLDDICSSFRKTWPEPAVRGSSASRDAATTTVEADGTVSKSPDLDGNETQNLWNGMHKIHMEMTEGLRKLQEQIDSFAAKAN